MFPQELKNLLPQIITSWQVIAVTIVLVLYIFLVGYVAKIYRRPRSVSKTRPQKKKGAAKDSSGPTEVAESHDTNDALGLKEE